MWHLQESIKDYVELRLKTSHGSLESPQIIALLSKAVTAEGVNIGQAWNRFRKVMLVRRADIKVAFEIGASEACSNIW